VTRTLTSHGYAGTSAAADQAQTPAASPSHSQTLLAAYRSVSLPSRYVPHFPLPQASEPVTSSPSRGFSMPLFRSFGSPSRRASVDSAFTDGVAAQGDSPASGMAHSAPIAIAASPAQRNLGDAYNDASMASGSELGYNTPEGSLASARMAAEPTQRRREGARPLNFVLPVSAFVRASRRAPAATRCSTTVAVTCGSWR
jgi:hypothetical protein